MTCPVCSATNDADLRFCTNCGASLAQTCEVCGTVNAPNARFCGACGAPLEAPSTAVTSDVAEERKVVSVLFADLAGFTAGSDGADPEDVKARLRPYFARAREEIESLGGMVEKFIGDAVVGLFGAPTSREDDAIRAVQAAWRIARGIDALNEEDPTLELSIRIAVDTGEAVVDLNADSDRGETIATGDVMNTASRLQHEAPVGGVVVGERTYRSAAASGSRQAQGFTEPFLHGDSEHIAEELVTDIEALGLEGVNVRFHLEGGDRDWVREQISRFGAEVLPHLSGALSTT